MAGWSASIPARSGVTASTFGHPKLGADAADRAIRLDPNYGFGTASRIRNVYFLAERYEDALRMVERQPPESRTMGGLMQRAASYAALGRSEEARAAVAAALERHPDLSIQGLLSRPEIGDAERKQTEPLMREAGFPVPSPRRWRSSRSPCASRSAHCPRQRSEPNLPRA